MKLKIDVTQEDIDGGNDRPESCPVALAGTRALAEAGYGDLRMEWEPYHAFCKPAGLTLWGYRDGSDRVLARVPVEKVDHEAYEFASLFDDWYRDDPEDREEDEGPPTPFSFAVNLPLKRLKKTR